MAQNKIYKGLTDQQVEESRQLHGSNLLTPPKRESLWKSFLNKFKDPLVIITPYPDPFRYSLISVRLTNVL